MPTDNPTHVAKLTGVISPVITTMFPATTERQHAAIVARIAENPAYAMCRADGICFPDVAEVTSVATALVKSEPQLARPVPSVDQVIAYMSGAGELSPAERLHLGHEVQGMSDDQRLQAIPVDAELAPVVAAPKTKPARQGVDQIAKLAESDWFKSLSPGERMTRARRASADNPFGDFRELGDDPEVELRRQAEVAAHRAAGRELSPQARMCAYRAEQEAKRK